MVDLGWGTAIGGVIMLIVTLVSWLVGRSQEKRKSEKREAKARRSATRALNDAIDKGSRDADLITRLKEIRDKHK